MCMLCGDKYKILWIFNSTYEHDIYNSASETSELFCW